MFSEKHLGKRFCLSTVVALTIFCKYSPPSPKNHIWRRLSENTAFLQDFEIMVNRYQVISYALQIISLSLLAIQALDLIADWLL